LHPTARAPGYRMVDTSTGPLLTKRGNFFIARDAAIASFWLGQRLLFLACSIIALTTTLSAEDFGWIASLLAVCAVSALLAPAGIPYLFYSEVHKESQGRSSDYWRQGIGATLLLGPLVALLSAGFLLTAIQAPVAPLWVVGFVAVDVVCGGLLQSFALWLHARGSLFGASAIPTALTLARAVAALLLLSVEQPSAEDYMQMHVATTLLITVLVLRLLHHHECSLRGWQFPSRSTLARSVSFTLMSGGSLLTSELDKPLVARVLSLGVAGHYSAAYRVVAALATPMTAIAQTMLPKWAALAADFDQRRLRRSFLATCLLALMLGCLAVFVVHCAARIETAELLGEYAAALDWMSSLAWLAAGVGLHQISGTALVAVQRPLTRASIDIACLGLLFALLPWLAGRWGADGVAFGIVAIEWTAAFVMGFAFLVLSRSSQHQAGRSLPRRFGPGS
jgi:O-antigen/teichoic acid export membrane protein